jgi:hypothetical protein
VRLAFPKPVLPLRLSGRALALRNERIDRRDRERCAWCGVPIFGGSRHHRKFRSRRGGDEVSNGVLLCGSGTTGCHGWVHLYPSVARVEGFAVESWETPAEVPVRHFIYGWVLLDDEGGVTPVPR